MKPDAVKDHLWDKYKEVYVDDSLNLGVTAAFEAKNPYAMQQMTAVMLEAIRKGMWEAGEETARQLAEYHAKLVDEHGAGCSNFVCDNLKLRDMIAKLNSNPEAARRYLDSIDKIRSRQSDEKAENVEGQVLKEEKLLDAPQERSESAKRPALLGAILALAAALILFGSRKRRT
jgi:cobaltochelatase CobN